MLLRGQGYTGDTSTMFRHSEKFRSSVTVRSVGKRLALAPTVLLIHTNSACPRTEKGTCSRASAEHVHASHTFTGPSLGLLLVP